MNDQSKLFFYEANLRRGELRIPAGDILQIAELAIVQESEIAAHLQRCDEITYAISGRATVLSGDETDEMSAGQIHYIRRGEYHRIAADQGENFRYCCIGFLPDSGYSEIGCFLEAVRERKDFLIRDEGNLKNIFSAHRRISDPGHGKQRHGPFLLLPDAYPAVPDPQRFILA